MFPISEVRRVYDETVCKGQRITRASLYGKAVLLGLADNPGRCKDCSTYNPPDGGGGLRCPAEGFSNPEGSSYRDGGGRTFLGGKFGCDTSGSLEYGEGDARCPVAGGVDVDPRLKKLMTSNCREKSGPQDRYTVEVNGVKRLQCCARALPVRVIVSVPHRTKISDYIISAYLMANETDPASCNCLNATEKPRGRRRRLPSMSTLLPPSSSSPPDLPGGGVFDDLPVDRKSCQLLGPTALVRTHSPAHLFWHLTRWCF